MAPERGSITLDIYLFFRQVLEYLLVSISQDGGWVSTIDIDPTGLSLVNLKLAVERWIPRNDGRLVYAGKLVRRNINDYIANASPGSGPKNR